MKLDAVRQEVINLLPSITPKIETGALTTEYFETQYLQPHYIRNKDVLHKYEKHDHKVFCRQCIQTVEPKGMLMVHRLLVELSDDLVNNEMKTWWSLQCQNPKCDFDLITPAPQVAQVTWSNPSYFPTSQWYTTTNSTSGQLGMQFGIQDAYAQGQALSSAPTLTTPPTTTTASSDSLWNIFKGLVSK